MAFLAPIEWPPTGSDVYVVLDDGSRIEGYFGTYTGLRTARWTVKDAAKVKHKLDEARIVEVGIRVEEPPARLANSMAEAIRNGRDERVELEWIVFERVPVTPEASMLLQVVNPGFDGWMKVFPDPFGGDGASIGLAGITVAGGGATSWLAWRKGDPAPVRVGKKGYDEAFPTLFCPAMATPDPLKWASFADHVAESHRRCASDGER